MYYRNANCAVVVYDITQAVRDIQPASFKAIIQIFSYIFTYTSCFQASLEKAKAWVNELQRQADPNIVIALAGNKCDLDSRRAVETEVCHDCDRALNTF